MDDRIREDKFFRFYFWLEEINKRYKKRKGTKIPDHLSNENQFIYRIAMNPKFKDSYNEIANHWNIEELMEAIEWIDFYEDLEEKEQKKMNAKKG